MKNLPDFRLMRHSPDGLVSFDEHGLEAPLPVSRPSAKPAQPTRITYRAYLETVELFIRNHWREISEIAAVERLDSACVQHVDIIAEKHGGDYHPARVRLQASDRSLSFVVNVALTERGSRRLSRDFHLLDLLRARFKRCFVPAVYFYDEVVVGRGTMNELRARLFLGEWLERYWEFHISGADGSPAVIAWDTEKGYCALSESNAEEIYKQSAFILTYYYDLDSGEQIFPWHHAAGDFVASSGSSIKVRLITVRQYASLWTMRKDSHLDMMQALLLFLANLTLRMRLDRQDGIGDIFWLGPYCAAAAMNGFLDGLAVKVHESALSAETPGKFVQFLKGLSPTALAETFQDLADSYDEDAPDVPVIRRNLADHTLLVYRLIQQIPGSFIQPKN
jgi:hypothetical protein